MTSLRPHECTLARLDMTIFRFRPEVVAVPGFVSLVTLCTCERKDTRLMILILLRGVDGDSSSRVHEWLEEVGGVKKESREIFH